MGNTLKTYTVLDIRADYRGASGQYSILPFAPLGTAAGLEINKKKNPNVETIAAYVPCDGVGLSFAASATAVSQYVFRNYLGNTGGTGSPRPGTLLEGYGLLDISQSNEYLDLVGSLSRGTGTGANYSTAVNYVNDVIGRLNSDFPNIKWAVKGVPFNHYFLITAQITGASGATGISGATGLSSSFGSGSYFHPGHPSGDVTRVYDWTNAPSNLAEFYRNRSSAPLSSMVGIKWVCPSAILEFDNSLPFLKNTFDPETMYRANRECFDAAKSFVEGSGRNLKVIPVTSPIYNIRRNEVFDHSGGIGTGSSSNATPTPVNSQMFLYQVVQPMKDSDCDGLVLWNNLNCMAYNAATGPSGGEQTVLSRNFFSGLIYENNNTSYIPWYESLIKIDNAYEAGKVLAETNKTIDNSIQFKSGVSCCGGGGGGGGDPCVDVVGIICKCSAADPGDLPLCSANPNTVGCCTLAQECNGVECNDCACSQDSCQYDPVNQREPCPPDFKPVSACGFLCNICCSDVTSLTCKCCCASPGTPVLQSKSLFYGIYNGDKPKDGGFDWRSTYMLPRGGSYGSSRLSINKNIYFLKPSVVAGLDPLFTGQSNFLNFTGSIF